MRIVVLSNRGNVTSIKNSQTSKKPPNERLTMWSTHLPEPPIFPYHLRSRHNIQLELLLDASQPQRKGCAQSNVGVHIRPGVQISGRLIGGGTDGGEAIRTEPARDLHPSDSRPLTPCSCPTIRIHPKPPDSHVHKGLCVSGSKTTTQERALFGRPNFRVRMWNVGSDWQRNTSELKATR